VWWHLAARQHTMLRYVAVRCSVWQCLAVPCIALRFFAFRRWPLASWQHAMLRYKAVCCSVLQCVAVCCSVLQCAAVCCSVLQCAAVCCSVLQCAAVCCGMMQYVAVRTSALQCLVLRCLIHFLHSRRGYLAARAAASRAPSEIHSLSSHVSGESGVAGVEWQGTHSQKSARCYVYCVNFLCR